MQLPRFNYFRSPLSTGVVQDSKAICRCCGQGRGLIYTGPIYAEEMLRDCICPWCIADGSAYAKLGAEFNDSAGIGACGDCDDVPMEVVEEITQRTPGIATIQGMQWWTHCNDAAVFIRMDDDYLIFQCRHCGKNGGYQDFD